MFDYINLNESDARDALMHDSFYQGIYPEGDRHWLWKDGNIYNIWDWVYQHTLRIKLRNNDYALYLSIFKELM